MDYFNRINMLLLLRKSNTDNLYEFEHDAEISVELEIIGKRKKQFVVASPAYIVEKIHFQRNKIKNYGIMKIIV